MIHTSQKGGSARSWDHFEGSMSGYQGPPSLGPVFGSPNFMNRNSSLKERGGEGGWEDGGPPPKKRSYLKNKG